MNELDFQRKRLAECEAVIEEAMQVVESAREKAGPFLEEIRDSKLYSLEYSTFAEYVKQRWGRSREWAYKVIQAEKVKRKIKASDSLLCNGYTKVTQTPNLRAALELAKVPEEKQAAVWEEAVKSGDTSAKGVNKISGGTSFDVEEIELFTPPAKPVKNGAPKIDPKTRKAAVTAFDAAIRAIAKCGLYERWIDVLSQIRTELTDVGNG